MIIIGRPINGITINGYEYVLDNDGYPMEFKTESDARDFLTKNEIFEEDIERYGIIFEEEEE